MNREVPLYVNQVGLTDIQILSNIFNDLKLVKIFKLGESFGEIALISAESKRTATMICKEDCYFLTLTRPGFNKIMSNYYLQQVIDKIGFLKEFTLFQRV